MQLAKKIVGCKVVGVVGSTHKVQTVYDLGADHVIDKSKENLWGAAQFSGFSCSSSTEGLTLAEDTAKAREYSAEGYDAIFDANGVETLKESYTHLSCGRDEFILMIKL